MKKELHIVASSCVTSVVKQSLTEEETQYSDVTYFPVDLCCHPLPKDYSDLELARTFFSSRSQEFDRFVELLDFVHHDYSKYDKVIIWHGDITFELLFLYMMCDLVSSKNLYEIDLTKIPALLKYTNERNNGNEDHWTIYMGSISPYTAKENHLTSYVSQIEEEKLQEYRDLWNKWKNTSTKFILNSPGGELKAYPGDFMDKAILQTLHKYSKYRMVLCEVFRKFSPYGIGDHIIAERISYLYEHGIIQALFGSPSTNVF